MAAAQHLRKRGRVGEASEHLREVEQLGRRGRALRVERLHAIGGLADIQVRSGSLDEAGALYRLIMRDDGGLLSQAERAGVLRKLSGVCLDRGVLDEAERALDQAQELARGGSLEDQARLLRQRATDHPYFVINKGRIKGLRVIDHLSIAREPNRFGYLHSCPRIRYDSILRPIGYDLAR